jgi:DNA invertase Pin-like site-specific DNA recombinase
MEAIAYVRVSSSKQATDGVSIEAQRDRIAGWCSANGYGVPEVYVDAGLSGGRADNRPALQAALARACRTKGALVTYSLSRLARSTKDALAISERLARAGADLVSLSERLDTTTAAGKMVFRMLAVLAEFERDLISERTAAAMRLKRERREYTGGSPPYGWRLAPDGVRLEPNTIEQQLVLDARKLRATGLSLRRVGRHLAAEGLRPRSGRRWHPKTVNALLAATVCRS